MRPESRIVALVPARSGSKRLPDKNVRDLAGHPLLAYTICAARASGVFETVVVSTDSERYAEIGRHYGAEPLLRPVELAGDRSPDIEWVDHALRELGARGGSFECFSILRPTSPFRLPQTICRAWTEFLGHDGVDSLRAVELCRQHPGKMWLVDGERMHPLLGFSLDGHPWHSCQYAALPEVYVQNASLEIAWSRAVLEGGSIAGRSVAPFVTRGYEGYDLNDPLDWRLAELLLKDGAAQLPAVDRAAWNGGFGAGSAGEG